MAQAITREEQYLEAMANGSTTNITPVTREEMYLAKATGQNVTVPKPVTRKEMLLQRVALNGGGTGGGGGTSATLIEKPITANGTYNASADGADGYSKVVVNVPNVIPDGYIKPTGTKPITENGTHDVTEYASVSVNVASSGGSSDADNILAQAIARTVTELSSDGVIGVGDYVFQKYYALKSVNCPNATRVGQNAFESCTSLESVNFLNAETVASNAFKGCRTLITANCPNASLVGNDAFNGCQALVNVNISNVTNLGSYAFSGCSVLPSIDLHKATGLTQHAFSNCKALTTVILRSPTLCTLANTSAFTNVPNGLKVYVPSALIETYQNATNWSSMYASGQCTFVAIEGSEYE